VRCILDAPATVQSLAKLRPRRAPLRFDKVLGRGVSEEIRRLRLEAAKRMLAEPDRQISSIAQLTGFGSATVMGQVFRRELGVNPSTYRSQIVGEKR